VRLYRRFIGRNKDRNKALFWQKRKVKSAKWKVQSESAKRKRSLLNLMVDNIQANLYHYDQNNTD